MKKSCPHCNKELKLVGEAEKIASDKTTFTSKYKCPVSGCGFTYTHSVVEETGE